MQIIILSDPTYNKPQGQKAVVEIKNPNGPKTPHYLMSNRLSASYDTSPFTHGIRVDHFSTDRENKGLDVALDQTLERLERSRARIEYQREQELYAYRKQMHVRRMVDRLLDSDLVKTGAAVVEGKLREYEEQMNAWRIANARKVTLMTPAATQMTHSGRSTARSPHFHEASSSGRSTGSSPQQHWQQNLNRNGRSTGNFTTPRNTSTVLSAVDFEKAASSARKTATTSSNTRFSSDDEDVGTDDDASTTEWRERNNKSALADLSRRMSDSAASGTASAPLSAFVSRRPSHRNIEELHPSKPKVRWADDEAARLLAVIGKNIRERAQRDGSDKKHVELRPSKPTPGDDDIYDLLRSNYTKVVKDAEEEAIYKGGRVHLFLKSHISTVICISR